MKKLLELFNQQSKTKQLEEEIENQDKQYTTLQMKLTKVTNERDLLEQENKRLEEANTKHLNTLREQRKKIKELEKTRTNC